MDAEGADPFAEMVALYRSMLATESDDRSAVGWKSADAERRNHAAVSELFRDRSEPFDVYEVGCGLGGYARFLRAHFPQASYRGCDLIPEVVERARLAVSGATFERRDILTDPPADAEYVVAMGAFNTSGGVPEEEWTRVVERMLRAMYGFARRGVAITFLTDRVDWKRELGVYRDPFAIARFAEVELSRFVELRAGYYPWEFCLHVLREPRPVPFGPPPVPWPPESRVRPDAGKW